MILKHFLLFLNIPEHLSMAASVKTVWRLLFKDVLLRNHNRKQHKKKFFIVHCTTFHGTSYSFRINKTTVYICPFKPNDVKIKTIFSLRKTIKVTFPWKKYYSVICFDLNYAHPFWLPLSRSPTWACPHMMKKYSSPQ